MGLKPRYRLPRELEKRLRDDEARERKAVDDFVEGAVTGDLERMCDSFDGLRYAVHEGGGWAAALWRVSTLTVPETTKQFFLQVVLRDGDTLRQDVGDDRALVQGLRALLPNYSGPGLTVYRGEAAVNAGSGAHGLSWTSDMSVARSHAETGGSRTSAKGSVLIAAFAPARAVISAPALIDDRYAEQEYIVDPRHLEEMKVLEEFGRVSHDDLVKLRARLRHQAST